MRIYKNKTLAYIDNKTQHQIKMKRRKKQIKWEIKRFCSYSYAKKSNIFF